MGFYSYKFLETAAVAKVAQDKRRYSFTPAQLRAQKDFLAFRWYLTQDFGGQRSYPHMVEWNKILTTGKDSKCLKGIAGDPTLILAPRGSAKSTFVLQWVAWLIGRCAHPDIRYALKILYVCFVQDIAILKSRQIKAVIESPRYTEVFPWVRKSRTWADKLWTIDAKHAGLPTIDEPYTLSTAGLTGAVASRRAHLIILDDLIKSPKAIENPDTRREMRDNWNGIIKPTMFDGARSVCLGTKMLADDIYGTSFTEEFGWQVVINSAILDDKYGNERSYCEQLYALETLQRYRKEDPISFSFQYQNKVMRSREDDYIDPELILQGKPPAIGDFDTLVVGADLSTSKSELSDYTVLLLLGQIGDDVWVLDMRRGRFPGNIDKCDVLITMLLDWGILDTDDDYEIQEDGRIDWGSEKPKWKSTGHYLDFFPESVGYQRSLESDYERYITNDLKIYNVSCEPIAVKGDKRQKAKTITGLFQLGRIHFNKYRRFKPLIDELTMPSSYDDCVDALVVAAAGLGVGGKVEME